MSRKNGLRLASCPKWPRNFPLLGSEHHFSDISDSASPSFTQTPSLRLLKEPVMRASLNLTWPSDVIMVLKLDRPSSWALACRKACTREGQPVCLPAPSQSAFQIFPGRCCTQAGGWRWTFAVGSFCCQGAVRWGARSELEKKKNIASRHKFGTLKGLNLEVFISWRCTVRSLIGSKHCAMSVLKAPLIYSNLHLIRWDKLTVYW